VRTLILAWCIPAILSAQDALEIVKRAVAMDRKDVEIARNYTFLQREQDCNLDGSGKVKDKEVRTWDITMLEGSPYRRLVGRNDQPLPAKEKKQEEEKLQRSIEQRQKETPEQRQARMADWDRHRLKQREPVKELPEAFNFTLVGEEAINGGRAFVIDALPKPGYKPKTSATSFFPKVKARFWIDKQDYQWVKMEMVTLDTISFGGFLFRIAKGGRLVVEQTHVNNEVWLPLRASLQASARLALVKGIHKELDWTFSDYKKFQAESRIVSTEPVAK